MQLFYKGLGITERRQTYQTDERSPFARPKMIDREESVQRSNITGSLMEILIYLT